MISATCQPVRRPFAGSPLRMDGFRAVGGPPTRGPVTARGLLDDQRPDVPPHHLRAPPGATPLRPPLKRAQHSERASPDWPRRALLGLGAGLGAALASALLAQRVRAGASKGKLTADYYKSTADIISQTKGILELPAEEYSADATAARLEDFKTATKAYVADYRTLVSPGQKSFSETYGVITAVLGHFTTFGVGKRPLPEKLKTKERGRLAAAEKALAREMQRDTSEFTPV